MLIKDAGLNLPTLLESSSFLDYEERNENERNYFETKADNMIHPKQ